MAAVAIAHGLNASLLRRFGIEQDRADASSKLRETMALGALVGPDAVDAAQLEGLSAEQLRELTRGLIDKVTE